VSYRPRLADDLVRNALGTFGAVIVQGPRAVGKTTSGLQLAASAVRLDASPNLATLAELSPARLLDGPAPRLIDEWQLAPTLWNAVRHEVDARGLAGQFILTGSATPTDDITRHSGAGRFRRVTLRPMSLHESGDSNRQVSFVALLDGPGARSVVAGLGGPTVEDYAELVVRGGWPALVAQPSRSPTEYLAAYLDDIARADLRWAGLSADPVRVGALQRALARHTATEASANRLALEADIPLTGTTAVAVSAQTVRKYLDALTRVFVLEEQPAWAPHLRSKVRLRVRPKWHFVDPSLAAAALRARPQALLEDLNTFGLLFESLAVRDLRIYAQALAGAVYHYRDDSGLEVDAVVELGDGRWAAFEVKLGGAANLEAAAANLRRLAGKVSAQRADQLCSLNVLTAGNESYTRPDQINVIALGHLSAA
jgi:predicted AAA+ superfamily ATPase